MTSLSGRLAEKRLDCWRAQNRIQTPGMINIVKCEKGGFRVTQTQSHSQEVRNRRPVRGAINLPGEKNMAGSGYAVGLPPAGQLQACCTLVAGLAAIHDLTPGYVCVEGFSFNVHEQICNILIITQPLL